MPALAPPCCDLGTIPQTGHYPAPPPRAWTDPFGFTYRLCEAHYRALLTGLQKAERFRPKDAVLRRTYLRRVARSTHPLRSRGAPSATGEELRRARQHLGWSLRRLADECGYSRAQLQAAECGRRRVAPEVAAWVRRILAPGAPDVDGNGAPRGEGRHPDGA